VGRARGLMETRKPEYWGNRHRERFEYYLTHARAVFTTRNIITLIVLIMSLLPIGGVIAEFKSYSGYDYMWFEPGHYLHYTEIYDTEVKDLEVVYQETVTDGIFITLNFLDRKYIDSSLLGGSDGDKIRLNSGYPSSNEFNLWFLITLPKIFIDGDMWKYNDVGCRADYIGDWIVKGKSFSDVIKISINSLNYGREYLRGEGEAYLAKDIGIIDWEFRKANGEVFKIEIEDWGKLPPRIISGTLTLDGIYPANGYHIGLSNRHENDATSKITDEMGRFSFIAYGHKLTLRYASILSDGRLDWDEHTEYELVDIDSDITDLFLSLGYPPLISPPLPPLPPILSNLIITPDEVEREDNVIIGLDIENIHSQSFTYIVTMQIGELTLLVDVELGAYESMTVSRTLTMNTIGYFNVTVDGLTGSFEVKAPPKPAEFTVSDLSQFICIEEGADITIFVNVSNVGDIEGTHQVDLKLDGEVVYSINVTLPGGATEEVPLWIEGGLTVGTYQVEVEGLTDSFTVESKPSFWDEIPGFPYESIVIGLIAVITILRARNC